MQALCLKKNINRHPNQPTPQTLSSCRLEAVWLFNLTPQTQKLKLDPKPQNPTTTQPHHRGKRNPTPHPQKGASWTMDNGGGGRATAEGLTMFLSLKMLKDLQALAHLITLVTKASSRCKILTTRAMNDHAENVSNMKTSHRSSQSRQSRHLTRLAVLLFEQELLTCCRGTNKLNITTCDIKPTTQSPARVPPHCAIRAPGDWSHGGARLRQRDTSPESILAPINVRPVLQFVPPLW